MNKNTNVSPEWNPVWFQDMKTQRNILRYKMANESLTMEERDTLEYLSTIVDDISRLLEQVNKG
jgi:hypothetical protein